MAQATGPPLFSDLVQNITLGSSTGKVAELLLICFLHSPLLLKTDPVLILFPPLVAHQTPAVFSKCGNGLRYRTDVKLCTSGHLNHNKPYKPSENIKQGQWYSARKQTSFMTEKNQFPAENERARKMKRFSGNFCSSSPLLPVQAESSCPYNRRPQSPVTAVGASVDFSSTPLEMLKLKILKKKVEEGTDRLHMCLKRDELGVSEVMVLKNKPVMNRQCVTELVKEEYQFISSYLAGITKTEQINKFLYFQKEFIAKHELLQNDFTGGKVSEQHKRKLAKERKGVPKLLERPKNELEMGLRMSQTLEDKTSE
ncbi:LOW QUALITY PROTEIN: uncharacterized protein C6orf118 homolog [Alca torda]